MVDDGAGGSRSIHRVVGSGSSFGANSLRVEVGVGEATVVDSVKVRWPTTGTAQEFTNVATGRAYRVVENADALVELDLPSFDLLAGAGVVAPVGATPSSRSKP